MTSVASGIPGVEVKHQWNGAILNDLAARPTRIRLLKITGIHGMAPSSPQAIENVERSGEYPLPTYTGSKDVIYEGIIESKTLDGLRVFGTNLRGAFRNKDAILPMQMLGAVKWQWSARCIAYDSDDEQTASNDARWRFARNFTVGFRLYDPRAYAIDLAQTRTGADLATVEFANLGNTGSPPLFSIPVASGAIVTLENNDILIPNTPYGHAVLKTKALPQAGTLSVDFLNQTLGLGGKDVTQYVDLANANWWHQDRDGIQPGGSDFIKVSGASAAWTAYYYHASE